MTLVESNFKHILQLSPSIAYVNYPPNNPHGHTFFIGASVVWETMVGWNLWFYDPWHGCTEYIENNVQVSVNDDFLSRVRQLGYDFQSYVTISLLYRFTSDKKLLFKLTYTLLYSYTLCPEHTNQSAIAHLTFVAKDSLF